MPSAITIAVANGDLSKKTTSTCMARPVRFGIPAEIAAHDLQTTFGRAL
jgi:hypothetical protein